jgi:hypothetical protein
MATLSGVRGQAASKKKPIAPAIDVGRMWVRYGGTKPPNDCKINRRQRSRQ